MKPRTGRRLVSQLDEHGSGRSRHPPPTHPHTPHTTPSRRAWQPAVTAARGSGSWHDSRRPQHHQPLRVASAAVSIHMHQLQGPSTSTDTRIEPSPPCSRACCMVSAACFSCYHPATYLPGRTDVQCLHRWQKVLNPNLVKGGWTPEVRADTAGLALA
jgi:hypothetical protein